MKPKIIVANWKCNPETSAEAQKLFNVSDRKNVVIADPFIFLYLGKELDYANLGAQDSFLDNGPFTGEVSARQLVRAGVKYVILGHSERRTYFNETDEVIVQKAKSALDLGLSTIICVGEEKREATPEGMLPGRIMRRSIINALSGIPPKKSNKIIVAYEPIWAIGTGVTPDPTDVNDCARLIKSTAESLGLFGVSVLYGGSVDENNCPEFLNQPEIDGLLVGGASIVPERIEKIIKVMNNLNGDIHPVIKKIKTLHTPVVNNKKTSSETKKKEISKSKKITARPLITPTVRKTAKRPKIVRNSKKTIKPKRSPFSKVKKSNKNKR